MVLKGQYLSLITFPNGYGFLGTGCRKNELSEHASQSTCTRPTRPTYHSPFLILHTLVGMSYPPSIVRACHPLADWMAAHNSCLKFVLIHWTSFNFYYVLRPIFSLACMIFAKSNSVHFAKLVIFHLVYTIHISLLWLTLTEHIWRQCTEIKFNFRSEKFRATGVIALDLTFFALIL